MKIRILASGEEKHVENSLGSVLVSAGLAEVISSKDPNDGVVRPYGEPPYRLPKYGDAVIPQPSFSLDFIELKHLQGTKKVLCIKMDLGAQTNRWFGDPRHAASAARAFGRQVPSELWSSYVKQWKENPDLRAPDEYLNPPKEKQLGFTHVYKDGVLVLLEN